MLKNDYYNFVFVHIQKTAGTSITAALKQIPGTHNTHMTHGYLKNYNYPKEYFKFCFVRNPWDRLVSWYNMHKNLKTLSPFPTYTMKNTNSFSDFLKKTEFTEEYGIKKSIYYNQLDYVSDDEGNILVDFIGKYENLNEDFNKIKEKLNLKDIEIPVLNKLRKDGDDYRKYYTDEEIALVSKMYEKDINYFNYKF